MGKTGRRAVDIPQHCGDIRRVFRNFDLANIEHRRENEGA
jgi:hypothetical protein